MNNKSIFDPRQDVLPDGPLEIYHTRVQPEWIDYNGHMNVAYYVLAFDKATDAIFDFIDVGAAYAKREEKTFFALQTHVNYVGEVKLDDPLRFTLQIMDSDPKRLHLYFEMHHEEKDYLAATYELLGLHVNLATRRSEAMPEIVQSRVAEIIRAHSELATPERVGGSIMIRKRS